MRNSGILMPVSSLPGKYGIGSLGKSAYSFVRFLKKAGQGYWQILPIGPTGYGDSPYQSFSAFAANPYFIDIDLLYADGLLTKAQAQTAVYKGCKKRVNYEWLFKSRFSLLEKAAASFDDSDTVFTLFCETESYWLDDYALFMAIKGENNGNAFLQWPSEIRMRSDNAIISAEQRLKKQIRFWRVLQFLFFKQWTELKKYANNMGIKIIGDIPIYVSPDSAELWAHPEMFQTSADGIPSRVAGCPPDAFSELGQLWGNPLYNWDYHKSTNYAWWLKRLSHAGKVYDTIRIDHFRGFESYYCIKSGAENAVEGVWEDGPGADFIRAIKNAMPSLDIIAEDLGFLTPKVKKLLSDSGYPGMKVLQFAFDSGTDNDYLPHNYSHNCVVYTGTHDNTTSPSWQAHATRKAVRFARKYLNAPRGSLCMPFIRAAMASVADLCIIPMADWLSLEEAARINTPSTLGGNWEWRISSKSNLNSVLEFILTITDLYGRRLRKKEITL